jgi:hypothetical protein
VDEMNDDWNLPPGPTRRGSRVARIGRPAALVAGGVVAGAVLAGALSAGAETLTGASAGANGYPNGSTDSYASGEAHGDAGAPNDTPVTGDELAKVTVAVKANDSSVSVTSVRKDPDGSYDVFATKSGSRVRFEVSADLKTIMQGAGGHGGGGQRGGGGSADTPVTGDELTKVTAAVTAKDSSVNVTSVRKDTDGSYDVFATKSGSQVMYDVSADLKTITQHTFGGG